jgi:hypothetical protein
VVVPFPLVDGCGVFRLRFRVTVDWKSGDCAVVVGWPSGAGGPGVLEVEEVVEEVEGVVGDSEVNDGVVGVG